MGKYLYPLCLEQAVCRLTGGLFMLFCYCLSLWFSMIPSKKDS